MIDPKLLNDEEVLARTIYGEARGEGVLGMRAVAHVIKNRVDLDLGNDGKPDWWGEGYKDVCLKKSQFSCWLQNDPNYSRLTESAINNPQMSLARDIARDIISGNDKDDPTNGATHYHTTFVSPAWSKEKRTCASVGHHLFYKGI